MVKPCSEVPIPPIFIWAPADLGAYSSVEAAERDLEASDVESGIYTAAFDALGRKLTLGTRRERRRILFFPTSVDLVTVRLDDTVEHQEEFRKILIEFLEVCGHLPEDVDSRSWDDLVKRAASIAEQVRTGAIKFT
jgi:hypothetical protein